MKKRRIMKFALLINLFVFGAFVSLIAAPAFAVPVKVVHDDWASMCDPLFIPQLVDELGIGQSGNTTNIGRFPKDEEISAKSYEDYRTVCPDSDNSTMPDAIVDITNLTQPARSFKALWYVGNPNTFLSNVDGEVSQLGFAGYGAGRAFRIDTRGHNKPLISESIKADGIFEPNETWRFVIQDYSAGTAGGGVAGGAADFTSIGVAGGSLTHGHRSTGSIIGIPIPEPTSLGLLMLGTMGAIIFRRRR